MSWDESIDQLLVAGLTEQFAEVFHSTDYRVTVAGIDRHGSYIWQADKFDTFHRFVLLGLTGVARTTGAQSYELETSVGAEDHQRFFHGTVVSSLIVIPSSEGVRSLAWLGGFRDQLLLAAKHAEAISYEDLNEAYVVPRTSEPPEPTVTVG